MRHFLFFLALLISLNLTAQRKQDFNGYHYLNFDLGYCYGNMKDAGISPLVYSGHAIPLGIGYIYEKNRIRNEFNLLLSGNIYDTPISSSNTSYIGFYGSIKNTFLYSLSATPSRRTSLWVGGSIDFESTLMYNADLENAAGYFDDYTHFSFQSRLQHLFPRKGKKEYALFLDVTVPVYTLAYRPGYTYISEGQGNTFWEEIINTVIGTHQYKSCFFHGIGLKTSIYKLMTNGNRIGFSYHWEYFTTGQSGAYRLDRAKHTLLFSLQMNLSKHKL